MLAFSRIVFVTFFIAIILVSASSSTYSRLPASRQSRPRSGSAMEDDYSDISSRRRGQQLGIATRKVRQADVNGSRPCQCLVMKFEPHCGSDEKTYVDSCHFKCAQEKNASLILVKKERC